LSSSVQPRILPACLPAYPPSLCSFIFRPSLLLPSVLRREGDLGILKLLLKAGVECDSAAGDGRSSGVGHTPLLITVQVRAFFDTANIHRLWFNTTGPVSTYRVNIAPKFNLTDITAQVARYTAAQVSR
jgi:hypothetical protein